MAAPAPTARRSRRGSVGVGARGVFNQLGAEAPVSLTITVVILITALILTAAPRLYQTRSEDALQATLADQPVAAANLAVVGAHRLSASLEEPFRFVEAAGDDFLAANVPDSITSLIVGSELVAESFEFEMLRYPGNLPPPNPLYLLLRHMSNVGDHLVFTAGRAPQPAEPAPLWTGWECPPTGVGEDPLAITEDDLIDVDGDGQIFCELSSIDVFEVAFSEEALDEMGLAVGDRMLLRPQFRDPLLAGGGFDFPFYFGSEVDPENIEPPFSLIAVVSGSFVADDPDDPYWFDDPTLLSAARTLTADFEWVTGFGLMSPDAYSRFLAIFPGTRWLYTYRHFLDLSGITLESAPGLATDLNGLQTAFPSPTTGSQARHGVATGLTGIIGDFIEQRATTFSLLSIGILGTAGAALALVWLLAVMIAERQRRSTVQLRSRGGSPGQLTRAQVAQGMVLTAPAAALGALVSYLLIPGEGWDTPLLAAGLAGAGTLLFVIAGFAPTHRHLGELHKEGPPRPTAWRLVAEGVLVALALGAVVLLRRGAGEDAAGVDQLAMVAPLLIGLAVSLVALRLYLLPVRLVSWIVARRRGVVGFVGLRRVRQQASAARLPFTVVLLAATVAVFSQVVGSSINRGQQEASFHPVGADYLIRGPAPERPLPAEIDLSIVDGVEATALASLIPGTHLRVDRTFTGEFVDLLAIDVADYQTVVEGSPIEPGLARLRPDPVGEAVAGSEENPIPAIVSPNWSTSHPAIRGQVFQVDLDVERPFLVVEEVRDLFPTIPEGRPFVVISREMLTAHLTEPPPPTMMLVRAPPSSHQAIEATMIEESPALTLSARAPAYSRIHDAPLVVLADLGLRLGFLVGVGFAVVALIVAVLLIRERGSRDLGFLGTMGLDRRQGLALAMIELIPPAVIAGVVGGFLGIGIAHLLEPMMPLDQFVGPGLEAAVAVGSSPWLVVGVTLGLVGVVVVTGVALPGRHERRQLGELIKLGDD